MRRTDWRAILLWAVLGTAAGTGLCLLNLSATEDTLGGFVAAIPGSPAYLQQQAEGLDPNPNGSGHDGALFYALAHDPLDPAATAEHLDRPRYRAQRVLFPLLAWLLHPGDPGQGLIWTMFAVLVVFAFVGSVATGALSTAMRGPPWPAALFAVLPGSIIAMRIATPDAMAAGLVVAAFALSIRRRPVLATVAAVAAVLTREPTLLLLAAFAVWRRDRAGAALVVVPGAVAGAWWLYVRTQAPGGFGVVEFGPPFVGWWESLSFWRQNLEGPLAVLSVVLGITLAAIALVRTKPSHPLWLPIAVSCVALLFYSVSVLAPERNGTRMFLPIEVMAIVALVTRGADRTLLRTREPAPVEADAAPS